MSTTVETETGQPMQANSFVGDVWVNFKRWGIKTLRNPFMLSFALFYPIMFLVLFTGVFGSIATEAISQTTGESVSYVTYIVPAIVIQVALVAASQSGVGLVVDMETGMFEKVLVSPMSRSAVFLGKALSEMVRIVVQISLILVLGYVLFWLGSSSSSAPYIATGLLGVLGIIVIGVVFSIWFTAYSNIVAVITQDAESANIGAGILQIPLLFLSSAFLPINSLPPWIQVVATINPVTYGVDAARAFMLGGGTTAVLDVNTFSSVLDTVLPALIVLAVLDLGFGAVAVYFLNNASSSQVR